MGQQSWQATGRAGRISARQLLRAAGPAVLLALLIAFVVALRTPFAQPRAHFCLLTTSAEHLLGEPRTEYLAEDLAAFQAVAQTLSRRGAARPAVKLDNLRARGEMQTLTADLERALGKPTDILILYVATAGVAEGGTPYLLCGNFEAQHAETGRYALRRFLEQVSGCQATVKLLLLDVGSEDVDPRLGSLVNDFPGLLRDEVQRTRDSTLWVLSANSGHERSRVSRALERSAFGYFVTQGLLGAADLDGDATVSVRELQGYVTSQVGTLVGALSQGLATQTPELLWGGGPASRSAAATALVRVGRTKLAAESPRLASAIEAASQTTRVAAFQGLNLPPASEAPSIRSRTKPSVPAEGGSDAVTPKAGGSQAGDTGSQASSAPAAPTSTATPGTSTGDTGTPAAPPAASPKPSAISSANGDHLQQKAGDAKSADSPGKSPSADAASESKPAANAAAADKKAAAAGDKKAAAAETEAAAAVPAATRHRAELLLTAWQLRDALDAGSGGRPSPLDFAPHLWRELQERLLRYDQRFRAGPLEDAQAFTDDLEELVAALRQFLAGEPVVGGRGGAVVEQLARLQRQPGLPPESVYSLALAEELAQRRGASLPAELRACATAMDGFLVDGDAAKFSAWASSQLTAKQEQFNELRLAKQLAATPQIPWPLQRLALRVRRESERAAARATEGLPWVRERLATADRQRWDAERALWDRIDPQWQTLARQRLENALGLSLAAIDDLDLIRGVQQQVRRLAGRVPDYLRWRRAAGPDAQPEVPGFELLNAVLTELLDTWTMLETPDPAALPKLRRLAGQLESHRQQLETGLHDAALAELIQAPGDPWKIESLLMTALPRAAQRCRLLQSAAATESRRLDRAVFREVPETIATAPAPTRKDWQRWLEQARLETKVCRLATFPPSAEASADDPTLAEAAQVTQAFGRLEKACGGPDCESLGPAALADLGTALERFYRVLPRRAQSRAAASRDLTEVTTRDTRLKSLRAALRAARFVDARDASVLTTLNLEHVLQLADDYDGLAWHRSRVLQARDDASAEEARYLTDAGRAYRELAASIEGQPAIADDLPALVTLSGPNSASLATVSQVAVPMTLNNVTGGPARIWLILDYDPQILAVEVERGLPVYPVSAARLGPAGERPAEGQDPYRPDRLGLPPTVSITGAETAFVRLHVSRKGPASGPTGLIVKALALAAEASRESYVRHPVELDLPNTQAVELQVAGRAGTWSETPGKLSLFPYANRATTYQLRLANPVAQAKQVELQWLTSEQLAGLTVPRGSLSPAEAGQLLERLAPTSVVLPTFPATLPASGSVAIPFPKPAPPAPPGKTTDGAPPAATAASATASPPAAEASGTPLSASLLVVVTDRETRRQTFRLVEIRAQRPRRFLRPQVGYDPQRERIDIRLAAVDASLLPPEPVLVQVRVLGPTLSGNPIELEGQLDPLHPELRLTAPIAAARERVATVELTVGGYPRAFVYEVPCWALATDVPEKKDLLRVRVTGLPRGRLYKSPTGPIPVDVRVDAPLGAFENSEDEVRVGIDVNRDRELAGDPAVTLRADRQVQLFLDQLSPQGELAIRTKVGDFQVSVPPPGVRSARVNVLAELTIAGRSVWSDPLEVVLDGSPPRVFQPRLKPGPEILQGTKELEVSVLTSDDELSGVAQVEAAFDLQETGRFAPDAKPVLAALNPAAGTWDVTLPVDALSPGAYRLLLRATDAVGNVGDYATVNVRVLSPAPIATDGKGQIQGRVTYQQAALADVEVKLKTSPDVPFPPHHQRRPRPLSLSEGPGRQV